MRLTLAHNLTPTSPKGIGAADVRRHDEQEERTAASPFTSPTPSSCGSENTNMSALRTGTLDFGALGLGALLSVAPEVAALGLPFLYSNLKTAWAALDGPVGQDLAKRIEAKNLVFLGWWCNGIRQTTNSKRPITKPDDLKGLRIRTPLDPSTVDMFCRDGRDAAADQLGRGVSRAADAAWSTARRIRSPTSMRRSSTKSQKYLSFTNHKYEPTALLMSTATWNRLSEADRKIVRDAATETQPIQRKSMADSDEALVAEFKKMPNFQMNSLDTAPFKKATEVVWDEWEKKPFGDFVKKLRATRA